MKIRVTQSTVERSAYLALALIFILALVAAVAAIVAIQRIDRGVNAIERQQVCFAAFFSEPGRVRSQISIKALRQCEGVDR